MKKLNNKGITLVELIVSFALVSVSVIYFYQTVYTIRKLYGESQNDTNHYVKANFALRLADEYYGIACKPKAEYNTTKNIFLNAIDPNTLKEDGAEGDFCYISFKVDNKPYKFYKKPIKVSDKSLFGYDAMLMGDTKISGEGSDKYFEFDGEGDFIKLPILPGCKDDPSNTRCINWKAGFIVEFKAQFELINGKLPAWGRIIDFGNGPGNNNIYISGGDAVDSLVIGGRSSENYGSGLTVATVSNPGLTTPHTYRLELSDNNSFVYIDGVSKSGETPFTSNGSNGTFWSSATRKINYIGKSNWTDKNNPDGTAAKDRYFKGKIYYIRIDAYVGDGANSENDVMQRILDINANNFKNNN